MVPLYYIILLYILHEEYICSVIRQYLTTGHQYQLSFISIPFNNVLTIIMEVKKKYNWFFSFQLNMKFHTIVHSRRINIQCCNPEFDIPPANSNKYNCICLYDSRESQLTYEITLNYPIPFRRNREVRVGHRKVT